MGRVLFGIILLVVGAAMTIKSEKTFQMFGQVAWAEKHMGPGQSRTYYQFLGTFLAFVGMAVMFNLHIRIFIALFGGLFGLK